MSTLQTENKIIVIYETDQIAQMAFCFLTGAYLLKATRPPDSRPPAVDDEEDNAGDTQRWRPMTKRSQLSAQPAA